jgi:hypothetical protein
VQFAAPESLRLDGVENTEDPRRADYVLVGRYVNHRLTYAWLRPLVKNGDRSALPLRTAWRTHDASALRDDVIRLRRIFAWHVLESPPSPYRLRIRDARTRQIVEQVIGNARYELVARAATTAMTGRRHLYAFAIDPVGRSILLFPRSGSVENRFPLTAEITLGQFEGAPPYGVDTYFLLTTDAPLPNPWILQWDGVRAPPIPANWSIERRSVESVPPRRYKVPPAVSLREDLLSDVAHARFSP